MVAIRSLLTGLLPALLISLPAFATEPTPIHDGDRVTGGVHERWPSRGGPR